MSELDFFYVAAAKTIPGSKTTAKIGVNYD